LQRTVFGPFYGEVYDRVKENPVSTLRWVHYPQICREEGLESAKWNVKAFIDAALSVKNYWYRIRRSAQYRAGGNEV
jgi:hypothetical protein